MRYPGLQVLTALFAVGIAAGAQTPTPAPEGQRERIVRRITTTDSAALNRASLGVTLSRTGTRRDTLGIFISSVAENGPAERAGIFEGDRIAAINGVDVRTTASDVADSYLAGVAQRRLTMELRRLTAGQRVSLRVWSGGRYKDVQVTTARLADVYPSRRVLSFGDILVPMPGVHGELHITPPMEYRMLLPGRPPRPPRPPRPCGAAAGPGGFPTPAEPAWRCCPKGVPGRRMKARRLPSSDHVGLVS